MISITCIRYLDVHYRELRNKFQSTACATGSILSWGSEDIVELLQYLDCRPFIKYSLEYLTQLKEDPNDDPDIRGAFSDLDTNLKNCPSSLQICLLERLTDFSTDGQRVKVLNHLLAIAAVNGLTVAVGTLLAVGAECNTALHHAARGGHQATVRLLLDQGAHINARDIAGKTPLHRAAFCGGEATVGLLLDYGADIKAKDSNSQTPLHKAAWGEREVLLLDRGADVEARISHEQIPLHNASSCGHEATIGLLLDRGAGIKAKDSNSQAPLYKAVWGGREVLLLDRGADIEARISHEQIPLHSASSCEHEATIGLLLDRGADIEATDPTNQTLNLHQPETWNTFATRMGSDYCSW